MPELYERIQYLEEKLIQLLANYEQQKAIVQKLQQENQDLKQMIATKDRGVAHSSEDNNMDTVIRKLSGQPGVDKMISNYIKDIDQCIAFLEKLA